MGSKIYKGSKENYLNINLFENQIKDQKKFFNSEILVLEHILSPFLFKFGYKTHRTNLFISILFWVLIFFPQNMEYNFF